MAGSANPGAILLRRVHPTTSGVRPISLLRTTSMKTAAHMGHQRAPALSRKPSLALTFDDFTGGTKHNGTTGDDTQTQAPTTSLLPGITQKKRPRQGAGDSFFRKRPIDPRMPQRLFGLKQTNTRCPSGTSTRSASLRTWCGSVLNSRTCGKINRLTDLAPKGIADGNEIKQNPRQYRLLRSPAAQ